MVVTSSEEGTGQPGETLAGNWRVSGVGLVGYGSRQLKPATHGHEAEPPCSQDALIFRTDPNHEELRAQLTPAPRPF